MSIVFGFPNTKNVTVSETLSGLGINKLRCVLSSFETVVTVTLNQPGYRQYANYLPAYMSAYVTQNRTSVMAPYHPLIYQASEPMFPLSYPDVAVSFPGIPSASALEFVRGIGGREVTVQRSKIWVIPRPSQESLRVINQSGPNHTTPAPFGSVNMACLSSLSLIRRILSNFFFTHQYPAFIDAEHLAYNDEHWKNELTNKRPLEENETTQAAKRTRITTRSGSSTQTQDVDINMDATRDVVIPTHERVLYAIPPKKIETAWETPSSVPDGDGIFVRFVAEIQSVDNEKIAVEVIVKYFLGTLGSNADAVRNTVTLLKGHWGLISRTDVGKVLSHMLKCVDLGIQAQARIVPLFEDTEYVGCLLMGAGFQISAYGETFTSKANHLLRKDVEQAGSTAAALLAMRSLIETDENGELMNELEECVSWGQLRRVLNRVDIGTEKRDLISSYAKGIRFHTRALNVSPANIVMVLTHITNNDDIPDNYHLHSSMLFEQKKAHVFWSGFGSFAPSFRFVGGPKIDLTTSRNLPKHIGIRNIPLREALIDLDLLMSEKAYNGTSLNRRSGPYKDRLYTSVDATQIVGSLVGLIGGSASANTSNSGNAGNVGAAEVLDLGF